VKSEVQILEPVGRNTAPAVAVVALHVQSRHPDACMLVLPSDHLIQDIPAFHAAIATRSPSRRAVRSSLSESPARTRHRVRYIERGEPVSGSEHSYRVKRFVEKPDLETARRYVRANGFSGTAACSRPAQALSGGAAALPPRDSAAAKAAWKRANATSILAAGFNCVHPPVRRIPSTMP